MIKFNKYKLSISILNIISSNIINANSKNTIRVIEHKESMTILTNTNSANKQLETSWADTVSGFPTGVHTSLVVGARVGSCAIDTGHCK